VLVVVVVVADLAKVARGTDGGERTAGVTVVLVVVCTTPTMMGVKAPPTPNLAGRADLLGL